MIQTHTSKWAPYHSYQNVTVLMQSLSTQVWWKNGTWYSHKMYRRTAWIKCTWVCLEAINPTPQKTPSFLHQCQHRFSCWCAKVKDLCFDCHLCIRKNHKVHSHAVKKPLSWLLEKNLQLCMFQAWFSAISLVCINVVFLYTFITGDLLCVLQQMAPLPPLKKGKNSPKSGNISNICFTIFPLFST